jgi:hypothetical protein
VNVVDYWKGQHDPTHSERIFSWRSLAGAALPPRDPDDDEIEDEEDDEQDEDLDPAVIREPDE